ncbi:DMT family transporter [Rubritalea spongiae]|uniref:DMT family transporter n=1 Tax=Rubritalea spongiae TaxID=430797 RepID=A0ABW5E4A1_9BACT
MYRPPTIPTSVTIPSLVILGSFLFCAKGIIVKLMYAEGLVPSSVMALRMLTATPVFVVMVALHWKKLTTIRRRDWGLMGLLAFIGYYLCSLVNMIGLQYISVGLERVILFSYPSIVIAGSILFQGSRPKAGTYIACILTWVGLSLLIHKEISFAGDTNQILYGSAMVLLSAIIYASYIMIAKPVIQRVGVQLYTGLTMCICAGIILGHFSIENGDFSSLFASQEIISYGAAIGIAGTVIPLLLLSYALSKISSSSYAVISSIGPILTIVLSILFIGQLPDKAQCIGLTLSIVGGIFASLQKQNNAST